MGDGLPSWLFELTLCFPVTPVIKENWYRAAHAVRRRGVEIAMALSNEKWAAGKRKPCSAPTEGCLQDSVCPRKHERLRAAERKPRRRQIRIDAASEGAAGWKTRPQRSARPGRSPLPPGRRFLSRPTMHERRGKGRWTAGLLGPFLALPAAE